jgi:hypothetical protein
MILPRRLLAAPLLMLALSAGPLSAATTARHRTPEAWSARAISTGVLSEAWAFMGRIWGKVGGSTDLFEKSGSSSDPFGNPAPTVQAVPVAIQLEGNPGGTL